MRYMGKEESLVTRRDFLRAVGKIAGAITGATVLDACGVNSVPENLQPPLSPTAKPENQPKVDTTLTIPTPQLPQESGIINADVNLQVPTVPGVPDAEGKLVSIQFSPGELINNYPDSQVIVAASVNPETYQDQTLPVPTNIVRGRYNLIPVAAPDGALGVESNGFTATAVPEQIFRRNGDDLQVLVLDPESEGNHWRYVNTETGAKQYIPKTIKRPDGNHVYLVVSRNLKDMAAAYFIAIDGQGNISRYASAVLEAEGEGQVPALDWQAVGDKWQTRGHEALTDDHVTNLMASETNTVWGEFDPNLNANKLERYAFTDERGVVHEYPADQIVWMPLQVEGVYQPGVDAQEVYGLTMLLSAGGAPEFVRGKAETGWQAVEKLDLPNGGRVFVTTVKYNGEAIERMLILLEGKAVGVNEVLNENGRDVAVLGENLRYVFRENGWEGELPEDLRIALDGLKSRGQEWELRGNDQIVVYNLAGQEVKVANLVGTGQWEKTDALLYSLPKTKEEAAAMEPLPWEYVARGGTAQVAKLEGQPFPETARTDSDLKVYDGEGESQLAQYLSFDHHNTQILLDNEAERPYRPVSYFKTRFQRGELEPAELVGAVYQWLNVDGTVSYLTYLYRFADFVSIDWKYAQVISFAYKGKIPDDYGLPLAFIGKDEHNNELIRLWAETGVLPLELESGCVVGTPTKQSLKGW